MVQLLEAVTCPETKGGNPPFSSKDYYPKKNDRHFFQQTSKLSAVIINPPLSFKTQVCCTLNCNLHVPDVFHYEGKKVLEKVEEIHSWKVVLLYPAFCSAISLA